MTYKLVKFEDGTYGARTWFFGYKYLDLKTCDYAWRSPANVHRYGKGGKEQALKAIAIQQDKGTVV